MSFIDPSLLPSAPLSHTEDVQTQSVAWNRFVTALRQWKNDAFETLARSDVSTNERIDHNVKERTHLLDIVLKHLWDSHFDQTPNIALIAVGGYGRGEMLPKSDVDLLILHTPAFTQLACVELFVTQLWDLQLDLGISVRTLEQCEEAARDITVATTLIECRLIAGDVRLSNIPRKIVSECYTDNQFFTQKAAEQKARHAKFNYTEYNLEPDIKNAPGGLRDIHQIGWVAKRHFRVTRFYDLVHLGFLTEFEYRELYQSERFLWRIRHHLHTITGRNENRLLFDFQHEVAALMGYHREEHEHRNAAVERLMRDYYRMAMSVSTLNEMLLAYFYESVIESKLPPEEKPQHATINQRFKRVGAKVAVQHHRVFSETPSAILEIFELISKHPELNGIRARTLRLLMLAAKTMDTPFRNKLLHRQQFMNIINTPHKLFYILKDMKRYGVLGRYLPAFGQIIGLMQYDLFHIYTVDAHTLVLIRNIQHFAKDKYKEVYPLPSIVYKQISRKDLLILGALFHDIAKGRGGDHSVLGAQDAIEFCRAHGLGVRDANIVAWLTRHHLLMSMTAQKQDINDPDVVEQFALTVGDEQHLDLLYVLTVADINATNPTLWNSWKASLLSQLYRNARRVIRTSGAAPIDRNVLIEENKHSALKLLEHQFEPTALQQLWEGFGDDYFLREIPSEIAWHSSEILKHGANNPNPLVLMREHQQFSHDAVQIFVYMKDTPNLFAATVATLDQMGLSVLDARIMDSKQLFCLDTYIVLDLNHPIAQDKDRQYEVIQALYHCLATPEKFPQLVRRKTPRLLSNFMVPSEVNITPAANGVYHIVEVITLDVPGLLAKIGYFFVEHHINVMSAKIATLGERAEDIFHICNQDGTLLSETKVNQLKEALKMALEP